jgi:poly-beta-1,6-N-acetyl-D-glucosamine biosynthesis protein PgaD
MSSPTDRGFPPATIPPEPFRAPLIVAAPAHRRGAQIRDAMLTAVLWCAWLYMLVAAFGALWVPPFVQRLLPVEMPDDPSRLLLIVIGCMVAALLGTGAILARALKDRRRFAGEDRRRETPEPTEAEMVDALGVPTLDLVALRAARRVVLHHGPDGRVVRAETDPDMPPAGTPSG